MASTAQHMATRNDPDIIARLVSAAEQNGITDASSWASSKVGLLVAAPVAGDQSISDVFAYAKTLRDNALASIETAFREAAEAREAAIKALPPRPGVDDTIVTDALLHLAVAAVNVAPTVS